MQLTRQEKESLVDELATMMDEYPVVGMLDMHSLPARQLQEIKKELVGDATIKMTRKTLIHLALEQSDRENITDLQENTAIQPALIFTDSNPFSLYKLIQEKKTSAAASGGEIAPNDIIVEAGLTDLDPGPMLGQIQELGAQTAVEDGKIKVENDAVAVEEGAVIDTDTAEILNNLGMEPLEVGLDLKVVYQDGEVFDKDVLAIDADDYRQDLEAAAGRAFNLAVNAGYITEQTAVPMLQQRATKARNLAINGAVINAETIEPLLSKAADHARGLDSQVDRDAVDLGDDTDADDASSDESDAEDTEDETEADTESTDESDSDADTDEGAEEADEGSEEAADEDTDAAEEDEE
jgi:large subunit ribosomal protein L10